MESLAGLWEALGTTFEWINRNSGGIGIVATIVSLIGAVFSWTSARKSALAADRSTRQSLASEVALSAKAITVQISELERLGFDLVQAYMSLGVFTGNSGSSRLEAFKREADEKVARAKNISGEATGTANKPLMLTALKNEELMEMKLKFEMVNVEIGGLQRMMKSEFDNVNAQVRMYQEKRAR